MNIYQKIAAVQKRCTYVKKDSNVNNQYMAVSHDAVLLAIREALIDNGVVVMVSQQEKGLSLEGISTVGKEKREIVKVRFEAIYDISFINTEDPEDRHTVSIEGHGEDYNDKAPGKAISYATKTCFLKTFMLETGVDDEERLGENAPRRQQNSPRQNTSHKENSQVCTISEAQGKMVFARSKAAGIDIDALMKKFGVGRLGEIKSDDLNDVLKYIEDYNLGEPF